VSHRITATHVPRIFLHTLWIQGLLSALKLAAATHAQLLQQRASSLDLRREAEELRTRVEQVVYCPTLDTCGVM